MGSIQQDHYINSCLIGGVTKDYITGDAAFISELR
jgi:hypothetical protein